MHGTSLGKIVLAGVFLLLVGCGSGSPAATATAASQPPAPTPTQSPRTLNFKLTPINDPMKGTVIINIAGSGYTMTVALEGLTPNSRHLINMHGGTTCAIKLFYESRVGIVARVTADAKGTITSVTTWPSAYSLPADGRILTIHGNEGSDAGFGHIACADMPS